MANAPKKPKAQKKSVLMDGSGHIVSLGKTKVFIPSQVVKQVEVLEMKAAGRKLEITPELPLDVPAMIVLSGKGKGIVDGSGKAVDCTVVSDSAFAYVKELKSYTLV